jgi:hypothetical protein
VAEAPAQHTPTPAELLRAALEKIVFFEWRLSELAGELAAAQSRCASAELERSRAEDQARAAHEQAKAARMQTAELEAERARLASLLSRPQGLQIDTHALDAERDRAARLQAELEGARRQLEHGRAERERWLSEMIEQARSGDEAPAALAQFISELRGQIITLRDRQARCDELLAKSGIAPPPPAESQPPPPPPRRESGPVEEARKLWDEGRLGGVPAAIPSRSEGAAARALADQCLRNLGASDPARREQAARHLAAVPVPSAAPFLANALSSETDSKARAQIARALAVCGGEGAAEIVAQLQAASQAPLVRLAALEALCTISSRARAAIEAAAQDPSAGVRRRAAALAASEGFSDLLARFSSDADPSVRAAAEAACREAPPPAPTPVRDIPADAVLAVQSAIFGLSEAELGERLGMSEQEAASIASQLLSARRIGRRGRRLVAAEGG